MKTSEEYVHLMGTRCPVCDSSDIKTTDVPTPDGGTADQPCMCDACGAEWVDQYTLTGFHMEPPMEDAG